MALCTIVRVLREVGGHPLYRHHTPCQPISRRTRSDQRAVLNRKGRVQSSRKQRYSLSCAVRPQHRNGVCRSLSRNENHRRVLLRLNFCSVEVGILFVSLSVSEDEASYIGETPVTTRDCCCLSLGFRRHRGGDGADGHSSHARRWKISVVSFAVNDVTD